MKQFFEGVTEELFQRHMVALEEIVQREFQRQSQRQVSHTGLSYCCEHSHIILQAHT